jgi:hypothetical protein
MIAPQIDMVAYLGNVIGASIPALSNDAPDFAAMVAAVSATLDTDRVLASTDVDCARTPTPPVADYLASIAELEPETAERIVAVGALPKPAIIDDLPITERADARPAQRDADAVLTDDKDAAAEPFSSVIPVPPSVKPIVQLVIAAETLSNIETPVAPKARMLERTFEKSESPTGDVRVAIAVPIMLETVKAAPKRSNDKPDPLILAATDQRVPLPAIALSSEKPVTALPDRMPTFAPMIADVARDLVRLAQDKNVRFNVRPETLGPVAVTIERSDAGPSLRLSVETQAAVQAVRHAEPLLNDARGAAPFVHVSVDLSSPEGRSRTARAAAAIKRGRNDIIENSIAGPVITGRYA